MAEKLGTKGYEENIVSVKGIVIFGIGLAILIVISFWLMYVLESYMEEQAAATKDEVNPVREAILKDNPQAFLPPEPRLQAAPGHGVDGPSGRISLELKPPQAEWWEIKKIWDEELAKGQVDPKTGMVITLPIEEAKRRVLEEGLIKAKNDEKAKQQYENSKKIISYSSSGRLANEIRR
ncbi:MAG: hypothetical protein N2Z23_10520 [Pyrinomonadaceae bacterium]|nr:hypothetical protein [Pyrinomonadaceae bacterium]MCX7640858.1 hypothetical protein [Pyrinomonadaceae bacterium]MDW8304569.1 hypothetical protein [Acidobacteriota bacterium]